jgi:hypothetical protein
MAVMAASYSSPCSQQHDCQPAIRSVHLAPVGPGVWYVQTGMRGSYRQQISHVKMQRPVMSRLALSDPRWQDAAALCIVKLLWIWAENMDMCA